MQGISVGSAYWSGDYYFSYNNNDGIDCYDYQTINNDGGDMETDPIIEIYRNGQRITNATQNAIVGEQIHLTTAVVTCSSCSPNFTSQWTVPGSKVQDYQVQSSSGVVTPLTNFSSGEISYYWVDGADGRQVQYTITVNGRQYSRISTFNVKRPSVTVTSQTSSSSIYTTRQHQELLFGQIGTLGGGTPGIAFTRNSLQIPSGFSGETDWVQIIDYSFTRTLSSNGQTQTASGIGLDSRFPYSTNDPNASNTADSPGVCLRICGGNAPSITKMETRLNAGMWLMFKPNNLPTGENSIYVPLQKVSWNWSATATVRPDFLFDLTSDNHLPNNPSGIDTNDFPMWNNVVTGNEPYQ